MTSRPESDRVTEAENYAAPCSARCFELQPSRPPDPIFQGTLPPAILAGQAMPNRWLVAAFAAWLALLAQPGGSVWLLAASWMPRPTPALALRTLDQVGNRPAPMVEVNGEPLTEADFERFCRLNGIPPTWQRDDRAALLAQWVDRQLVEQHLRQKKLTPHPEEVERALKHVLDAADRDPEQATQRLAREFGSLEELRQEFTFRLGWRRLVETHDEGRAWRNHFEQHRDWYDGTRVRARQIFLKVPRTDRGEREAALTRLREVRSQVERGELDFGDAARKLSQAPSRDLGGDLGWFSRTGTVPNDLAGPAFERGVGELAGPLEGESGVHLLQVTEREVGSLSLEDARERVLAAYGRELWAELVPRLRRAAKTRPAGFGRPVSGKGAAGTGARPASGPPEGPPGPPGGNSQPPDKPRGEPRDKPRGKPRGKRDPEPRKPATP